MSWCPHRREPWSRHAEVGHQPAADSSFELTLVRRATVAAVVYLRRLVRDDLLDRQPARRRFERERAAG